MHSDCFINGHMTCSRESECFISALSSNATLKFYNDNSSSYMENKIKINRINELNADNFLDKS